MIKYTFVIQGDPPPPHLLPHVVRLTRAQIAYETTSRLTLHGILMTVGVAYFSRSALSVVFYLLADKLLNVAATGFELWISRKRMELASKRGE